MASKLPSYPFDLSNGWTKREECKIKFENNRFVARVVLSNDIDVCIQFARSQDMLKKLSTTIAVEVKTKHFQVNREDLIIDIECGSNLSRKILSLSDCLSQQLKGELYSQEVFNMKTLMENDNHVNITIQLREIMMHYQQVYKRKKRKKMQSNFLENYGFKRVKVEQPQVPWKCYQKFQLRDDDYDDAIYLSHSKLKDESLSGLRPTIDVFPSKNGNYQKQIGDVVTGKNGFFDVRYDCKQFWKKHVVWANPPYDVSTIRQTLKLFKMRKIRGFLCVPIWIGTASNKTYVHNQKYAWIKELLKDPRSVTKLQNIASTKSAKLNLLVLYYDFSC